MPNTVRRHRVQATKPDKIYRAFIEADAMAKWLPPNGFTCTVHHLDGKVGGTYRMSFRNFTTGMSHSFGGKYVELVPGERLRYTDKFEDPNLPEVCNSALARGPALIGSKAGTTCFGWYSSANIGDNQLISGPTRLARLRNKSCQPR